VRAALRPSGSGVLSRYPAARTPAEHVTHQQVPLSPRESGRLARKQGLERLAGTGCHPRSTLVMKGSAVRIRASASRRVLVCRLADAPAAGSLPRLPPGVAGRGAGSNRCAAGRALVSTPRRARRSRSATSSTRPHACSRRPRVEGEFGHRRPPRRFPCAALCSRRRGAGSSRGRSRARAASTPAGRTGLTKVTLAR
jgi:hypothetical protein